MPKEGFCPQKKRHAKGTTEHTIYCLLMDSSEFNSTLPFLHRNYQQAWSSINTVF